MFERPLLRRAAYAVLAAGCSASPLAGQGRDISQLQVRFWTDEAGLPVNAVTDLTQTPEGYIWVGTESGLARFDGVTMAAMNAPGSPLHTRTDIQALEVGPDGTLWVGTGSGLVRGRKGRFEMWAGDSRHAPLATGMIQALARDRAGRIWVGVDARGIFVLEAGEIVGEIPTSGSEPLLYRGMAPAASGGVWVATNQGVARTRGDSLAFHPGVTGATRDVRTVIEDGHGDLWVGTREGLYRASGDRLVSVGGPEPLRTGLILAINEDPSGHIWVATSGHGLFRHSGRGWERLDQGGGLPSDDIHSLFTDQRGELWVGSSGGVALVYSGDVLPITPEQGLAAPVALAVLEDESGALWVGSFGAGVARIEGEESRIWSRADGLPNDVVLSLAEDSRGRVWVGTRAGARVWNGEQMLHAPAAALDGRSVVALMVDRHGRVWAGTTDGLFMIDGSAVTAFGPDQGLEIPRVLTLFESRDGTIFAGTDGGGAFRLLDGRFQSVEGAEASARVVMSFREGANGCLWIGGADGLARHCSGERVLLQRPHGLPDHQIARILADEVGDFWISTNRGVFQVGERDLDAVADGARERISPRLFTRRDGMPSTEANGGFHPAGWKSASGELFFPTMEGVALFDPAKIRAAARPPEVLIEGVVTGGSHRPSAATELPPGLTEFSIRYTAPEFRRGDLVEFQYRLTGLDTTWLPAGSRRSAYYTSLPPGPYTFSVRARLPGGSWSPAKQLPLRLGAHFWQTTWFKVLIVLLLGGTGLLLHRWTVRKFRAREAQLVALVHAREQAERRYRDIFENAQEVVITLDPCGRVEEANLQAAKLLGRNPEQLAGMPLQVRATDHESGSGEELMRHLSGDEKLREVAVTTPDGTEVRLETSVREIREAGRRTGFQLIGRDITERHRLEERLRQAQRMEAVGQLAGGVAHDFNNLLTVIRGQTEILLGQLDDHEDLRGDVVEISDAADRATGLTRQLLAFSRRQVLQPRALDLNEVIGGMQTLLSRLITEDIEISFQLDPDLGAIHADPGQIEQVIANLAVNARDAMPAGGRLTIRTTNHEVAESHSGDDPAVEPGSYVLLEVSDTGVGIEEKVRDRLFEPFFTTKAPGKGTGLGLATVYGIVEQSQGHIWVNSEIGKGSQFKVCFPRVAGAATPLEVGAGDERKPGGRETILVVEDDAAVRRLIVRILERSGYAVVPASDVAAALRLLETADLEPHLLVTDVVMPEMGGPELAGRAVKIHPELRIIFISGYTEEEAVSEGGPVQRAAFLPKPFSAGELLRTVRTVLDD